MILTIVATVLERHALPNHANTQLELPLEVEAYLSETVATTVTVKNILSKINKNSQKNGQLCVGMIKRSVSLKVLPQWLKSSFS